MMPQFRKKIVILGSTGSIGKNTLEVIREHPDNFEIIALAAGSNRDLFCKQVHEFKPKYGFLIKNKEALSDSQIGRTKIYVGEENQELLEEIIAGKEVDSIVAAIVGVDGLKTVYAGVKAGKEILLANKESLVCAGGILTTLAVKTGAKIIPVDSEHSAIFQCMRGYKKNEIKKVILTASGGPFLNTPIHELDNITPEQAVKHPKWSMGKKISVDSATLMNKALEVIEARWLFDLSADKIEVVIHPQSIVHGILRFVDGTELMQSSIPDMKGAIAFALSYPFGRLERILDPLDLAKEGSLQFFRVDNEKFKALNLAYQCLKKKDAKNASSCVMNIANELYVAQFLEGKIKFTEIVPKVEKMVEEYKAETVNTIEDIFRLQKAIC